MAITQVASLILPVLIPGLFLIVSLKKRWFAAWRTPIDGGVALAGAPLIGANKTWFGVANYLVGGVATAAVFGMALQWQPMSGWLHGVFSLPKGLAVGASVGAAYSIGEILNSLVKRRLGVKPGAMSTSRWRVLQRPIDLADGIVCSCLAYIAWGVSVPMAAAVLAAGVAIHLSTDALMRRLRLKRQEQHGRAGHDRQVV